MQDYAINIFTFRDVINGFTEGNRQCNIQRISILNLKILGH